MPRRPTPPLATRTLLVSTPKAGVDRQPFIDACQITMRNNLELTEMDCGHMMYLERPAETADIVTDFLSR